MKKEKGLTLIALIITIIVMLIIIGVSIRIATSGGLFSNAKDAAQKNELRALQERVVSCYEMDAAGDLDCAKTKSNIQTSLSESGYNYTIKDTSGSLPITVCVTSKYDNYYKIVVKEDGITAEIVDEAIETSEIEDIALLFMHGEGDTEIPVALVKTSKGADYSESDFTSMANDFFTYQYNLYHLANYLDSQYGLDDLAWIDSLTGVTSDEKEEIAQIVGYLAMVKSVKAGDVYDDIEDTTTQNMDVLEYLGSQGLFEANNTSISVNSLDDFLSFLNGHKNGYLDACEFYMFMEQAAQEEQDNNDPVDPNDPNQPSDPNDPNDQDDSEDESERMKERIQMVQDILDDNDFSSVDSLYSSLYSFDFEEMGITNTSRNTILNFIQKDKIRKLLIVLLTNSANYVKSSGPYFASVGKIDATAKSYTDNMFTSYEGLSGSEIMEKVTNEGIDIQNQFYGYKLKIGNNEITYSEDINDTLNEIEDEFPMFSAVAGTIGGLVILDPEVTVQYADNDQITVSFGDFSATKTKAEWKIYTSESEGD